ncbi:MAG: hypothetical protein IKJ11_00310 [Clostridia bacterium]|nr:hypothetical protein [Clostridia bacterium]
MDPAIKKVAIVLALALIVVLGLIAVTHGAGSKDAPVATEDSNTIAVQTENAQTPEPQTASADDMPTNQADAGEAGNTNEAQLNDQAQEIEMYEGALAGLSEEEIAKMALAEEQGTARSETTGIETAVD